MVDILTRRRQNNPILTGEAGVGKTAVVEGFALRIVQGDVPPSLRNVTVRTLDLALLQAGAGIKGEFENRLKGLIEEVKSSPTPIILFIDEAHTMIGAGGAAGQNDAANMLKPALARGELRTIAATTWSEYKKYFEKDPALARRFQVVKVEEPTEAKCQVMLRGLVPVLEKHHNVRILDEGLVAAVKFSHRYLPDRQLPDKAVSVLDTACARLALGQNATPPAIEDATRQIDDCAVQTRMLERETALGADHSEGLAALAKHKAAMESRLAELKARWEKERDLVGKIREVRGKLEAASGSRGEAAGAGGRRRGADRRWIRSPARGTGRAEYRTGTVAGRDAADARLRGFADRRRSGGRAGPAFRSARCCATRCSPCSRWRTHSGQARHRAGPRAGYAQRAHPHVEGRAGRSRQADRRVPAGGAERRRQDRDRAGAGGPALRRRAQHDHHQHVGVPGSAHRLHAEGLASRIRGLRRGRRADRSRAAAALFGGAAGRSGEGASGRAGAVLPGVRQGQDGRRRRPRDRFQEHDHHPDLQRRHRHAS